MAQQTTGDILGTVTDASGAAIPAANITLRNLATAETRKTLSNSAGEFVFNLLQVGRYSLQVESAGFRVFRVEAISMAAGDRTPIAAQLQVGSRTEEVVVSATPGLLQNQSSTVASSIRQESVENLPLNGRNFIDLVQIAPGANAGPANSIGSGNRPDDRRQSSAVSANGQSELLNNFIVDGLDNNEREQGFNGFRPSIEAIEEVRVVTNAYTAEVGRAAGSVISLITKSGTNQFHGSAYEYLRNDLFDASDPFAIHKPEFRQNQFGGSIGGPILRNRTFFFTDVEELRLVQGLTQTVTVPTLYEEQHPGDFSDIGGPVIPSSSLHATSLNYFKLYAPPNRPGLVNNYTSSSPKTQFGTTVDARVDHRFSDRDLFFARYGFNPVSTTIPGALPPVKMFNVSVQPSGLPFAFAGPSKTNSQSAQLNYARILNPSRMIELKAGYTRIDIRSLPLNYGTNLASKFGVINGNLGDAASSALPVMWFPAADYATLGDGVFVPILDLNNIFQYNGTATDTFGGHNVKLGAALIRRQLNYYQSSWSAQGGFIFGAWSGPYSNGMANFLVGNPVAFQRGYLLIHPAYRTWEPSLFVQDDWHASHRLTLNLGLRYEVFTPTREAQNRYSNFDVPTLSVALASSKNPTANVDTDYGNVSPRVGFAATLHRNLVLRGGFGISYYSIDYQSMIQNPNPPFSYYCFWCPATYPILPMPTASSMSNPSGTVTVKPRNFRSAYIEQFNLVVQKAIGANVISAGYVGELGRRLLYQSDLDRPAPPGAGNPTPPLVYAAQLPNVSSIALNNNAATSSYHALQLVAERRFERGFTFNANYTLAHGLSDSINNSGSSSPLAMVANKIRYDWGNSELDIRHRFALSAGYQLPLGRSSTGLRRVVAQGWQVNTISFWQSGLPFTVVSSVPHINVPGVGSDRPDVVSGQSFHVSNPSIAQWFNIQAFRPQTTGTAGNEHRNQLRGPHARRIDLSLSKDFPVREPLAVQFRAECFNITNTPNFALPNASISAFDTATQHATNAGGFGTISNTVPNLGSRSFQFALKVRF